MNATEMTFAVGSTDFVHVKEAKDASKTFAHIAALSLARLPFTVLVSVQNTVSVGSLDGKALFVLHFIFAPAARKANRTALISPSSLFCLLCDTKSNILRVALRARLLCAGNLAVRDGRSLKKMTFRLQ